MRVVSALILLACSLGLTNAYRPYLHKNVALNNTEEGCPGRPAFTKVVLCYYEARAPVSELDPCLCSHVVLTRAVSFPNDTRAEITPIVLHPVLSNAISSLRRRNPELRILARVSGGARSALTTSKGVEIADALARMTRDYKLDGLEVALDFRRARVAGGAHGKQRLVALVKGLRVALFSAVSQGRRYRRSYSVREEVEDDIPQPSYLSRLYIRSNGSVGVQSSTAAPISTITNKPVERVNADPLLLLQVSTKPGVLGKRFDLKPLAKYVDFFTVPTHNLIDDSEHGVTFHHSRLMGLSDMLNADSVLDLLTGLGAPSSRLVMTLPAAGLYFQLQNVTLNKPRSPAVFPPQLVSHQRICQLLMEGGWTVERDEDLTAPYAFRGNAWIALEDELSVEIKGKYALLRDLGGVAVWAIDDDDLLNACGRGRSGLTRVLASTMVNLARRPRSAVLESLLEPLAAANDAPLLVPVASPRLINLSPYRIVRVVDRAGAVQVVRRDAQTEFECSRQGYYRHPQGCDRFYRCVKFDQRSDDYSVFEYDCPPGLAFDEKWEVCMWPGQTRDSCEGSSEIRPVPRNKFVCSSPGYYADPENCRWFFACMDHRRDGSVITPYEFRCPYGLGFDEENLMCNWPWLVRNCGSAYQNPSSSIHNGNVGVSLEQLIGNAFQGPRVPLIPGVGITSTTRLPPQPVLGISPTAHTPVVGLPPEYPHLVQPNIVNEQLLLSPQPTVVVPSHHGGYVKHRPAYGLTYTSPVTAPAGPLINLHHHEVHKPVYEYPKVQYFQFIPDHKETTTTSTTTTTQPTTTTSTTTTTTTPAPAVLSQFTITSIADTLTNTEAPTVSPAITFADIINQQDAIFEQQLVRQQEVERQRIREEQIRQEEERVRQQLRDQLIELQRQREQDTIEQRLRQQLLQLQLDRNRPTTPAPPAIRRPQQNSVTIVSTQVSSTPATGLRPTVAGRPSVSDITLTARPIIPDDITERPFDIINRPLSVTRDEDVTSLLTTLRQRPASTAQDFANLIRNDDLLNNRRPNIPTLADLPLSPALQNTRLQTQRGQSTSSLTSSTSSATRPTSVQSLLDELTNLNRPLSSGLASTLGSGLLGTSGGTTQSSFNSFESSTISNRNGQDAINIADLDLLLSRDRVGNRDSINRQDNFGSTVLGSSNFGNLDSTNTGGLGSNNFGNRGTSSLGSNNFGNRGTGNLGLNNFGNRGSGNLGNIDSSTFGNRGSSNLGNIDSGIFGNRGSSNLGNIDSGIFGNRGSSNLGNIDNPSFGNRGSSNLGNIDNPTFGNRGTGNAGSVGNRGASRYQGIIDSLPQFTEPEVASISERGDVKFGDRISSAVQDSLASLSEQFVVTTGRVNIDENGNVNYDDKITTNGNFKERSDNVKSSNDNQNSGSATSYAVHEDNSDDQFSSSGGRVNLAQNVGSANGNVYISNVRSTIAPGNANFGQNYASTYSDNYRNSVNKGSSKANRDSNYGSDNKDSVSENNNQGNSDNFNVDANVPVNANGQFNFAGTLDQTAANSNRRSFDVNTGRAATNSFVSNTNEVKTRFVSLPLAVNTLPLVEKLEGSTGVGIARKFDRYGPGGWRSANETLGPDVCKREGLFRHPENCNKFYECYWDSWKERFTIHIFNCPIRLSYDPAASACNWPVGGPGCSGNKLLLHTK